MIYLEYHFDIHPAQPATDILLAELGETGFESFVETPSGLLAYLPKSEWHETLLNDCRILKNPEFVITWTVKTIASQNWNAVWEQNFSPITIEDKCRVRAPFHTPEAVRYDIVIAPQMSFGTGHHETTYMMLQHLLDTDCTNKAVLDMGCGTGLLAILAHKKGAASVDAIDIDPQCVVNTQENIERNNCKSIRVQQGDQKVLAGRQYHIILANINRNILLADIPHYAKCLTLDGLLLLSGFYREDLEAITAVCTAHHLTPVKTLEKNYWIAATYRKT